MYIDRNVVSGHYGTKDFDESDDEKDSEGNYTVWVISKDVNVVTPYTYDEAISLAGHGPYTVGLLVVCCMSLLAISIDIFGFSTVVSNSSCDLDIGPWQNHVLLSMPYLGGIATAYLWGYVSDTQGRRHSLIIAMWGGFITTTLSAFSPNWIVLAVLKFISVSLKVLYKPWPQLGIDGLMYVCLGFALAYIYTFVHQCLFCWPLHCNGVLSATYTLIGECCPISVKRTYFFILSSALHLSLPFYTALGYATLNMSFAYNLGLLTFTPWRLLILCMGLPLGISAVCLHGFYESPKFLANIGERGQALEILRGIWKRNRCVGRKYSVEKLILEEEGNAKVKNLPLLQSLWEQTVPLFRMPLLLRTLQLYFLTIVGYSTTNSLLSWFPFLSNEFISGMSSHGVPEGMCKIIEHSQNLTETGIFSCIPKLNTTVVWASTIQGIAFFIINICICKVTNRKVLVIVMMMIMSASSVGCAITENNIISLFLFFTIFLGVVVNGIMSSYFVDLYPTSYRGMVACLSMLVARGSGLVGTSVTGLFIMTHCTNTFFVIAANILSGVLVACFLPSDSLK